MTLSRRSGGARVFEAPSKQKVSLKLYSTDPLQTEIMTAFVLFSNVKSGSGCSPKVIARSRLSADLLQPRLPEHRNEDRQGLQASVALSMLVAMKRLCNSDDLSFSCRNRCLPVHACVTDLVSAAGGPATSDLTVALNTSPDYD
jgi:hypothetical protein